MMARSTGFQGSMKKSPAAQYNPSGVIWSIELDTSFSAEMFPLYLSGHPVTLDAYLIPACDSRPLSPASGRLFPGSPRGVELNAPLIPACDSRLLSAGSGRLSPGPPR